jgi:hypothetical protein
MGETCLMQRCAARKARPRPSQSPKGSNREAPRCRTRREPESGAGRRARRAPARGWEVSQLPERRGAPAAKRGPARCGPGRGEPERGDPGRRNVARVLCRKAGVQVQMRPQVGPARLRVWWGGAEAAGCKVSAVADQIGIKVGAGRVGRAEAGRAGTAGARGRRRGLRARAAKPAGCRAAGCTRPGHVHPNRAAAPAPPARALSRPAEEAPRAPGRAGPWGAAAWRAACKTRPASVTSV